MGITNEIEEEQIIKVIKDVNGVTFNYQDGSSSYVTKYGRGAYDADGRRLYCMKGGPFGVDFSKLSDEELIEKYARKRVEPN